MCGILFALNNDSYTPRLDDYIKDAFIANQVRGTDSTGMFQLSEGQVDVFKSDCNASEFVKDKDALKLLNHSPWAELTVGHVRAATMGRVSKENAHPFRIERDDGSYIVMVHNGTLVNWRSKPHSSMFTVDSEWMAYMLSTEGADAFEYFNGAFAIVWYDSLHPTSVFMARNKERPLHYQVVNDGKTIIGCSELGMLGWLGVRNNLEVNDKSVYDSPYYLQEGKIYQFSLETIGSFTMADYPKYDHNTSRTPVTYHPVQNRAGSMSPYHALSYQDDDFETDAWDDWAKWGYHGGQSANTRSYYSPEQEQLLEDVKEALRNVRNKTPEVLPKNTTLLLEHESMDSPPIERGPVGNEPDAIDKGTVKLTTVATSSCTSTEIERVKNAKMHGIVVRFSGMYHEPATSVLIGQFSLFEGDRWVDYDAEMRFIPSEIADTYLNRPLGDEEFAAICGVDSTGDWLVVAPLSKDEKKFVTEFEQVTDDAEAMVN